jgi:CubicO group peptidase (beta-lactamase class C family)
MARLAIVLLSVSHAAAAFAQPAAVRLPPPQSPAPAAAVAAASAPALTRSDLESWLDGFLPYALARGDVAGAVVVVVKDGQPLLARGYGYADAARRIPVDPEHTLFRGGSVGKLFTWTAVMQLVEQGKLDLDRDINDYLDLEIPPREGQAITLRNLMTHTPGFEEILENLVTSDSTRLLALGPYLKAGMPRRIFPPDSIPAYSNYGVSLAGYIVERVSGEPYDDYIERHIFQPLGMTSSTFRQPLPERFRANMSRGYQLGSGPAQPYELFGPVPAGALAATGADMGRFMIAHLAQGTQGALGTERILRAETARLMHHTALPILPPLHSMVLGFMKRDRNGRRIIGHEGDTQFFHSALSLFIDDGVGVYLSMNSTGRDGAAGPIRASLIERFADRYFPAEPNEQPIDSATAAEHARAMAGVYESSRRAQSSFLSLVFLPAQVTVGQNADGSLSIPALRGINQQPQRWREIAPFVWRDLDSEERLAAKVENGRVVMFSADAVSPFSVFLPVPWWKSSAWVLPLLAASVAALVLTVMAWPTAALIRRRYALAAPLAGTAARTQRLTRFAALATLVTLVAWVVTVAPLATNLFLSSARLDAWLWVLHSASLIVFTGAGVVALWNASATWTTRRSWSARLWSAILAVACLSILWVAVVFNLIAFTTSF